MEYPKRSALVDLVMEDENEEEKAEAIERWFRLLVILVRIADENEEKRRLAGEVAVPTTQSEVLAEGSVVSLPMHDVGTPAWKARLYQRHQ